MKQDLPYLGHDAQSAGPQYLEDLATGYWYSEVLFTAVQLDLFSLLEPRGSDLEGLAASLGLAPGGLRRYLHALACLGLVVCTDDQFFNTRLSQEFLVRGKAAYQGDSILWRKYLQTYWNRFLNCLKAGGRVDYGQGSDDAQRSDRIRHYIRGMDCIARTKAHEILRFFAGLHLRGNVLDVGAGSGAVAAAFLDQHPGMEATLIDLPDILGYTKQLMLERGFDTRITYCAGNILEQWPVAGREYDIVILSNIIHAYSELELPHILAMAAKAVKDDGLILVHDFFTGHCPDKAALSDLNMFINTFNGRVFSDAHVRKSLEGLGFQHVLLAPLETDTAVLFAARGATAIEGLCISRIDKLRCTLKSMGFHHVYRMKTAEIPVQEWTDLKCSYGCVKYGSPHCPPNGPGPAKTRAVLSEYTTCLLLEGEPPTRDFQLRIVQAEREAFLRGFPKAFAYWAGPCSLCDTCVTDGACRNTRMARPSMEGAGIDVFETANRAGSALRPLSCKTDFAKYFGLLLLE